MTFESLLARRYISSQKRHTLLTIFSIVIAVALMTMIFTSYSTLSGIKRASHYDSKPYHMQFGDLTEEQVNILAALPEVETFEKTDDKNYSGKYQVRVMFGSYIDDDTVYLQNLVKKIGIEYIQFIDTPSGIHIEYDERFDKNDSLLTDDLLTLNSRYSMVIIISLLCVFVIFIALALRLIIDTAFEVSSKERERQFGVLQSVGATPKQIVKILTHEGLMLSVIGVPLGALAGIGLGFAAYKAVLSSGVAEVYIEKDKIEQLVHYHISPLMILISMLIGTGWVWLSAYSTGMRIIRMTPIQAISNRSNTIKKVKKFSILGLIFGWKGKLAARNARRQPKRFIVTVLSLTLSLSLFASFTALIDSFTAAMTQMFTPEDALGVMTSEMEIEAGVIDPEDAQYDVFANDEDITVTEEQIKDYFQKVVDYEKTVDYHDANRIPKNAEKLMSLGYFKSIEYYTSYWSKEGYYVEFVNEAAYNRIYRNDPKVSFAEFEQSGKAILLEDADVMDAAPPDKITATIAVPKEISKEEYDRKKEENEKTDSQNKSAVSQYGTRIPSEWIRRVQNEDGEVQDPLEEAGVRHYAEKVKCPLTVEISDCIKRKTNFDESEKRKTIILPYSYYVNKVHTPDMLVDNMMYSAVLIDDAAHDGAAAYLKHSNEFYCLMDTYQDRKNATTILSAVNIGVTAANLMLALIAIVNMVNIVSTGILNRKSELGSLQCIGMTRGQEMATAIFECVQFVIFSGIAATILTKLLTMGAEAFTSSVMDLSDADLNGRLFQFSTALVKIWTGTAIAFIVALVASIIPLHIMNKQELVDQIRTVE